MKLVPAKCPSCGANIELDANSDRTVCDYCRTRIIVDEAIQKYKIEISGKVEVDGIVGDNEKLRRAEKHYALEEYNEAEGFLRNILSQDKFSIEAMALLARVLIRQFEIATTAPEEDLFELGDDFYKFYEDARWSENDDYDEEDTRWKTIDEIADIYDRINKIDASKLKPLLKDDLDTAKHYAEISKKLKSDEAKLYRALKTFDDIRDDFRFKLADQATEEKLFNLIKKDLMLNEGAQFIVESEYTFVDLYGVQRDGSALIRYSGTRPRRETGKTYLTKRVNTTVKPASIDEVLSRIETLTSDAEKFKENPNKFGNDKKGLFGLFKKNR